MKMSLFIRILLLTLVLNACASDVEKEDPEQSADADARNLYEQASRSMKSGQFETAIRYFQFLETRYPYSIYAQQAQLEMAYSNYKFGRPDEAIVEADRFIRLNPTHERVDYAYFIKGVAHFSKSKTGFFPKWFPRNPAEFEQKPLEEAFTTFTQLLLKFPDSQYAADARQRMIYIRDELAEHELITAQHYFKREAYIAAASRCRYLLENYSDSRYNIDAIAMMLEAYRKLELPDMAAEAERILELNAPDHGLLKKKKS